MDMLYNFFGWLECSICSSNMGKHIFVYLNGCVYIFVETGMHWVSINCMIHRDKKLISGWEQMSEMEMALHVW